MQWHDVTRKILGGPLGGPGKILGRQLPSWHPPSSDPAYFPCCFLKMAIKISHSHFVHVAFVSILVFQTFDRMIFGTLTFPGIRWYVMTVRDTQMVRDHKNLRTTDLKAFQKITRMDVSVSEPSIKNRI